MEKQVKKRKLRLFSDSEKPTGTAVAKAYLPVMNSQATAITMQAYRRFVHQYNKKAEEENKTIKEHNQNLVPANKEQKIVLDAILKRGDFSIEKEYTKKGTAKWVVKLSDYYTREQYNELAVDYNRIVKANILPLIPLRTIKATDEQVFRQMLFLYGLQLAKTCEARQYMGRKNFDAVPRVRINTNFLNHLKYDDLQVLNICKRSVQRYLERFIEAKILIDYSYCGSHKGALYHFNPQILAVFCSETQKMQVAENHLFFTQDATECRHKKKELVPSKNEIKIKAVFSNGRAELSQQQEPLQDPPLPDQEPNPTCSDEAKGGGGEGVCGENLPQTPPVDVFSLCRNLEQKRHKKTQVLSVFELEKEAFYGTMSREEFQAVLIGEMLKTLSKAYKITVFAGEWFKTFKFLQGTLFYADQKKDILHYKSVMLDRYSEYLWRLNFAVRYCKRHPNFKLLVPSLYFDPTRTQRSEGGFAYTLKAYRKSQKQKSQVREQSAQMQKQGRERKYKKSVQKEINAQVRKYQKGSITAVTLYEFVKKNFPAYLPYLQKMIMQTN